MAKLTHRQKAITLLRSNFWMAGIGHFNLTSGDIEEVFRILDEDKNVQKNLKKLYDKLEHERMG